MFAGEEVSRCDGREIVPIYQSCQVSLCKRIGHKKWIERNFRPYFSKSYRGTCHLRSVQTVCYVYLSFTRSTSSHHVYSYL